MPVYISRAIACGRTLGSVFYMPLSFSEEKQRLMNTVYLLKNQDNQYLNKSGEWVPGENQKSLYRSIYKDEALNQKAEFSVKNFELRITIAEAKLDEKGRIMLDDLDDLDDNMHAPNNSKAENPEPELALDDSHITDSAENQECNTIVDQTDVTNNATADTAIDKNISSIEAISTEAADNNSEGFCRT